MPSGRDEWIAVAKAIYGRFGEVQLTDRAAALTYYGILSLFPALLVVVALIALLGQYPETYRSIVDTLPMRPPAPAWTSIDSALRNAVSNRGNAGFLLVVGLLLAFYSASGAIGAAMRSLEAINRVKGSRKFLPNLGVRLGLTGLLAVLILIAFSPSSWPAPVREHRRRGRHVRPRRRAGRLSALAGGRRGAAHCLRGRLRARPTPHPDPRGPRCAFLPGAVTARRSGLRLLLFTAYVSHFGSYDKTYGTLGALISLLIWLWLGNLAFLLGALFNAETKGVRGQD